MIRILSRIKSQPWACTRETMDTIIDIASRQNLTPDAVAQELGRPLRNSYDVEMRDSVGVLPVQGPLIRYASMFSQISGATSYDMLAQDFARMVNDPSVTAILLNIDSPGGEANGVSEFADQIFAARGTKPIIAYIGGMGASAAYWIAAAADEIVINDSAIAGSIGTVMNVTDSKEKDAKAGVKNYTIVSSQSPFKRTDPSTEEGQNQMQAMVDSLSDVFVSKVAAFRGVDAATVLSNFGQGGVLVGQAAVTAGLADRIGSYEGVIAQLQGSTYSTAPTQSAATGATVLNASEEIGMDQKELAEKFPDVAAAFRLEGSTAATATATATERTRVQGIIASAEAEGRGDLAQALAFTTDMPVEAAVALLAKSPKAAAADAATPDQFAALMAKLGNPAVGADIDANTGDDTVEAAIARSAATAKQFGM